MPAVQSGDPRRRSCCKLDSRLDPRPSSPPWKTEEATDRLNKIGELAPGLLWELYQSEQQQDVWPETTGGIRYKARQIVANGPILKAHLATFAAKFGIALYREYIGEALPEEGGVETWHFLNAGLAKQQAEAMLSILPAVATLKQGKKNALDQFVYRLNTDEKSIVAALASFHDGLYVFALATSRPGFYGIPSSFQHRQYTRRGELTGRLDALRQQIIKPYDPPLLTALRNGPG